jgi:aminoglycoside phosphotransferase (APT) family kinase protein
MPSASYQGKEILARKRHKYLKMARDGSVSLAKRNWSGTGIFIQADGTEEQVFLRTRLHRQEKERLALQQVQRVHTIPAPRFLGMLQKEGQAETTLLQSYMQGVDLAQLLPLHGRPPPPVAYRHPPEEGNEPCLLAAMRTLGKAIAHLHAIKTDYFGELLPGGSSPREGRAFTLQKVNLLLKRGRDRGWLHQDLACRIGTWIKQQVIVFPEEERASLVHSDLHPGNIRVARGTQGEWQLQGVIDFEHAKYWYPEYDLVVLQWHLSPHPMLWDAFLCEYGQLNPARMQFFEIIKLMMIVSGHPPTDLYSQWARAKLLAFQQFATREMHAILLENRETRRTEESERWKERERVNDTSTY